MLRRVVVAALALALSAGAAAPARAGEPDATSPAYDVSLRGSDRGLRWTGRETLTLTNPGVAPLDTIWIRLWGNGRFGCRGTRHVRISDVAGATAGSPRVSCSAVPLRLVVPLAGGARGTVSFDVDLRVPDRRGRFGREGRRMALLSNAIPALAHLERGRWRLDRYFRFGEAWTYPAADWTVRLEPPAGVSVAAPGVVQPDGSRHLSRGRDYSFAAGRLRSLRTTIDGVAVTFWAPRGSGRERVARALRITRERLPRLSRLYGDYGWPDLQVVLTRDIGIAMEHTALIMTPPSDYVVTHELAHQWWYALIGNDQASAPWLDESFAAYSEEAAGAQRFRFCRRPGGAAGIVTRSTAHFRGRRSMDYPLVYAEGACLLDVLRKRMGHARFDAALRRYAISNRYGWSTGAKFRAAMNAASPVPLGDLWRRYRVS